MTKQQKHIRKSKKGKRFVAGSRMPKLKIKLTHYDSDGRTIATGDLFLSGRKIAWWAEDDMNRIDIYWIGEKKAIDIDEIDLKEKIRKEWRKQKFKYELFEQPAWSGGKTDEDICPDCGGTKWKREVKDLGEGNVAVYTCKNCGYENISIAEVNV